MGLLKDIETKYGVDANYWHIAEINIFWKTMRANVILDGYPDYQSRINLKQILARKEFNIDISDLTQIPVKNVLEIASSIYQLVKYYVQDFEYAENVIEEGQEIIDISPYLPVKAHIIPTKPIQDHNSIPYYPPAVILNRTEVSMLSAVVTVNSK